VDAAGLYLQCVCVCVCACTLDERKARLLVCVQKRRLGLFDATARTPNLRTTLLVAADRVTHPRRSTPSSPRTVQPYLPGWV
jgi:hypothetical protein